MSSFTSAHDLQEPERLDRRGCRFVVQFIINGAAVLFTLIAIATVDIWGRKPLMFVGRPAWLQPSRWFAAQRMGDPSAAGHTMLWFILLYIGCFSLSVGPVTWVILSEIYPTAHRGRALVWQRSFSGWPITQ